MFDLTTEQFQENPFPLSSLHGRKPGPLIVGKRKAPQSTYRTERTKKARVDRFRKAVEFAYDMDWPLVMGITVTWSALINAGEHNEGHCLGKGSSGRETYLRNEMARMTRTAGFPFAAVWGRDVGANLGEHVHMAMFWPSRNLDQLVALLERVTGSKAEFVKAPYTADVVARSACGGWQVNINNSRDLKASSLEWAGYIAEQHDKHPTAPQLKGKAFGISQAIGTTAQRAARPALDARRTDLSHLDHKSLMPASGALTASEAHETGR